MEPQQLAIAALNEDPEAAQAMTPTSRGKVSYATGNDMEPSKNNNIVVDPSAAQQQQSSPTNSTMVRHDKEQDELEKTGTGAGTTSSNNSQTTTDGDLVSTPPTSTSEAFSSQSTNADSQLSQPSQLSQLAAQQEPLNNGSPTRPSLSIPASAGQKRTADGQVKASSTSPDSAKPRGHSRTTSTVSNVSSVGSSRIGEVGSSRVSGRSFVDVSQLSSELRTRLSYAMIKVNNGWQTNTIDEVESLASQVGSPTSSSATLNGRRNVITSPRTAIASVQEQTTSVVPQTHAVDFDLYSRTDPPSRTYESFWRDHSATTSYPAPTRTEAAPRTALPHGPISQQSSSLGPAADIRPTPTSRRSGTPKYSKPPTIPGRGSNSPYNTSAPHTPGRAETTLQTPSQKTIQEQDAIETLLFMSSPGNSGNMGHTFPPPRNHASPQQSPLRAEFHARAAHGRRVEFDATATSASTESSEAGASEYKSRVRGKGIMKSLARGQAIDRLLDEMGDSSSDEEEIPLHYTSPRRIAAGRV